MTNEQYYDCIQPYQNACQIMRAKLEVLNGSLYQKSSVSPIHNIQERIKSKKSIEKKLEKLGHSDSVQNAKDHLRDIAGIRVICYFIDDIYNLVNALKRQSELIFIREKDYIQNPKPNGYRSFHVIIAVPVYYLDTMEYFPVEIQLRTMTMDLWARMATRSSRNTGMSLRRPSISMQISLERSRNSLKPTMKQECWRRSHLPRLLRIRRRDRNGDRRGIYIRFLPYHERGQNRLL